jgi:diacylglycerol kinase (ATP)
MIDNRKKIRFIINPISGIGKQKKIESLIQHQVDSAQFDYEICYTKDKAHATELSREAATMHYDAVVAVGGDGTINEVAQGLLHTETAMGIIPAGSGNGLAHYLKIPINAIKAIEIIKHFNVKTIDTGNINGRLFVSISGVGFDSHVAKQFSRSKNRGFWAYAKICFLEYIKYNHKRFRIYVNDQVIKKNAFMLSFANSDQFGFNARIAPTAVIDDGYLDLCIVRKPRIYYAAFVIPFIFMGLLHKTPFVKIIRAKEIKVVQLKNNIAHIDGDEIELGKLIEVSIIPKSLKIINNFS